ncbi:glucose-1-phosphate thymidylyltransferase : UTP-glucose-1-phosphate uridylyltransferase OS=Natronococcus amylolyticus DSM 10524 GN=C491_18309 PE=4 SV=1 [Gemmata massiliana]|uniref:Glucose-1-phosphate thymidylyltransferase: UTP-glucose-1-phosphate uridylyltransferase n=2 Tax=Gemmata massiliana TaxID=1210884 RepID=A0A6P2D6D8_9BACT|nr:glucose-1-phosphate thymidylyltransferase : UTP-glucose-1-phosphate uridylyltransferase OS=Natronococcus amylolyticus DSM 10524 GN=C491_18309 PE=4 SV=1 [Gemmata massiliana]
MFPINGRPLAEHLWRQFRALSSSPPIVIHSADDRSAVEWGTALKGGAILCPQEAPDGVANAVALARPHLTGPALVLLGDVVLAGTFPGPWPEPPAVGVWSEGTDATTVNNFGVQVRDGHVDELVEKPAPGSGLVCGIGAYLLGVEHLRAFRYTPKHPRTGEREITEALRELVRRGHRLRTLPFAGTYLNVNEPGDVAIASQLLPVPRTTAA